MCPLVKYKKYLVYNLASHWRVFDIDVYVNTSKYPSISTMLDISISIRR